MFGVTYKYRSNPLTVFTLSIISATLLEFTAGYVLDKFFDLRFWDYNVEILNFGNINGYICLRSVLGFGIAGIFLMYVLIPFLISLSKTIPKKVFLTISICLCSIFLLDELYNLFFARLLNSPTAMEIYDGKGFKYFEFNK